MPAGDPAGWSPTGCVAEPPPPDPSRRRIPGSPAPPPVPGPPSPLPRWPSQCLNLLLIPALPTRPPPLPSLLPRPEQPRPRLGPGLRLLRPPPPPGTACPPSLQPGGGGGPGAPGPARPRPFPGGRETCSTRPSVGECSGGRRVGPPRAEAQGAGATPVNAPGPAGGRASIPAVALGPGRARGCSHLLAPAGAARDCAALRASGQSLGSELFPPEGSGVGPGGLADSPRLRPCLAGPGGCC